MKEFFEEEDRQTALFFLHVYLKTNGTTYLCVGTSVMKTCLETNTQTQQLVRGLTNAPTPPNLATSINSIKPIRQLAVGSEPHLHLCLQLLHFQLAADRSLHSLD